MAAIVFEGVCKSFGSRRVLHDLSFRVEPGEIVGLLGPNGSGKTTTLRLIAGYYQADAGSLTIQGVAGEGSHGRLKRYVGYLPERAPLYDSLTVTQYLHFVGRCKGLKGADLHASVEQSIAAFELAAVAKTAIGRLSKGFRQRVGLGQAILGDPAVLLLDEATNGLDPMQIIEARDMIRQVAKGRAVVFSSHLMQEVEALCSRAIILRHGRLITDVSLEPGANEQETVILLRWRGDSLTPLLAALNGLPDVSHAAAEERSGPEPARIIRVSFVQAPTSLNPLLELAMAHGQVLSVEQEDRSVEAILVDAVRRSDRLAMESAE